MKEDGKIALTENRNMRLPNTSQGFSAWQETWNSC